MKEDTNGDGSPIAVALLVVVVVGASLQFAGLAVAATNVSISPDNLDANATGVTYNASGELQLGNQDTIQFVDVHLGPADVSAVGSGDIAVYINGVEYTDGFTEFSTSDGTVEFKLSNSQNVNDGDTVRIEVTDVTNPADDFTANATLHDTSDVRFQEFEDSVAINTPAQISYEDLAFNDTRTGGNDTTIAIAEDLTVSAVINNTGEQSGTYNASLVTDGSVIQWKNGTVDANSTTTVDFVTNFSNPGAYNVTIDDLTAQEVTVVGSTEIVDGAADPDTVDAGRTVDNQLVHIEVTNVSQDGDTDTHYVEFPNELADGLQPNSADANATSITSSVNLVDGFDDDGVNDTLRFSTSGDGGGAIDLNLTVDTAVSYPDREDAFHIDARTVDSSGEMTTERNVTRIRAGTAPSISNVSVANPEAKDIRVSFKSSEELSAITVPLTDDSNSTVATLTESEFNGTNDSGTWTYSATTSVQDAGEYTGTVAEARDEIGLDGAEGENDSTQVSTGGSGNWDGGTDGTDSTDDSTDDTIRSSPAPTVSGFDVAIDGQNVNVTVTINARIDELAVDLAGTEVDSLSLKNFTREREDGQYVYSAGVSPDNKSTVVGHLRRVANDSGSVTPDRVASATAGPRPSSFAGSPYAGANESRHTLAVRIAENASVTGQSIEKLSVSYSEAFRTAGGDLSSVSDDQNVEWLLVVAENGSVRSRLGDTDEVTVVTNAENVALNLSTVDSERQPTIRAGDRIVVGLEDVRNPTTADRYNATVTLESEEGSTHDLTTSVRVWNPLNVDAIDAGIVLPDGEKATAKLETTSVRGWNPLNVEAIHAGIALPDDEQATAKLEEAPTVRSAVVASRDSAVGPVQVIEPSDGPASIDDLSQPVVTTIILDRPVFAEDTEATLSVTLSLANIGESAGNHTIARYDTAAEEWRHLNTTVAERSKGTVTLQATTASTSLFAVLAPADDPTTTPPVSPFAVLRPADGPATTEPTATEAEVTDSSDSTDDGSESSSTAGPPWWTLGVLLLGLIPAGIAAARRRE